MTKIINNDKILTNESEIARSFGEFFQNNFTNNTPNKVTHQNIIKTVNDTLNSTFTTDNKQLSSFKEIYNIINSMRTKTAPGIDGIPNIIFKNIARKAIVQILCIVYHVLKTGQYPDVLKTARIFPILKANKQQQYIESYRPISLLNNKTKIIDRAILNRLEDAEQKLKILPSEQYGFRSGHSTVA